MSSLKDLVTASFAAAALHAQAVTIGFEEFGNVGLAGPVVTTQYPGVVFSSTAGNSNVVSSQLGIGFGQNFLCTATTFPITQLNCAADTVLTFAAPVTGLTFYAVGSNNAGLTAKVDVFQNGTLSATQDITTNGLFTTPNLVDLSAFNNLTAIRLYAITDMGGLGWDNFSYAPVPEPGTFALFGVGSVVLGLVGLRLRWGRLSLAH